VAEATAPAWAGTRPGSRTAGSPESTGSDPVSRPGLALARLFSSSSKDRHDLLSLGCHLQQSPPLAAHLGPPGDQARPGRCRRAKHPDEGHVVPAFGIRPGSGRWRGTFGPIHPTYPDRMSATLGQRCPGGPGWTSGGEAVSRVLFGRRVGSGRTVISLGWRSPATSCGLPAAPAVRAGPRRLFGLAPTGGCRAAVCCQPRGGLLPHRFTLTCLAAGGLFSVALSVASRRPGVTWQSALWSSDFPRPAFAAGRDRHTSPPRVH